MQTLIDSLAAQIAEAQVRNFERWPSFAPSNWQYEVDHVKSWLQQRAEWIDAQMAIDFAPKPPLFNQDGGDVSAGFELTMTSQGGGTTTGTDVELVSEGDAVRVHIPTNNSLGLTWTTQSFTPDSSWTNGSTGTGVGYERDSGYESLIDTDVESNMYNISTSVLCRVEFTYDGSTVDQLYLHMKYDDGFVAYINGTEVCRSSNVTNDVPGSAAAGSHEAGTSLEEFDISSFSSVLDTGTNVLAIHGINQGQKSSDMLALPKLIAHISLPPSGDVWYTTDGSDPRLFGGATHPSAIEYSAPVAINHSMKIRARSLDPQWSTLNEATFAVGPVAESLRITEIMYHPSDPNSEFIELTNIGTQTINLSLVSFTNGIDFTFSALDLTPNGYIVVVRDFDAFATRYPDFSGVIAGQYTGALDNGGEKVRLADALDRTIHDFSYHDSWYDITDGDGFSLVCKDPAAADPNLWALKTDWRPSAVVGGSPGEEDISTLPLPGSIVINEILAHSDTGGDWIELYNTTGEAINIGGLVPERQ